MSQTLTITDTGKRRTTSVSAEETDIANSGSAVSLFGVEVDVDYRAVLNTKPVVGKLSNGAATAFASGEVDHFGIEKPKWTIRGVLRDDNATDMAVIKKLTDMVKTKGYKTIGGDMADWADGTDNDTTINVRVESLKFVHRANTNIIDYTMTMWETE